MNAKFIVLSGDAGVGKDSVADVLVASHNFQKFSLADDMKSFAMSVFGFTYDQLYGPSTLRNEPDPVWSRPCPRCKRTSMVENVVFGEDPRDCSTCEGKGKINDNSPRRILQLLGDEWGRQMIHPDIWTLAARPKLDGLTLSGQNIVVTDARFENDRCNLAAWYDGRRVNVTTSERHRSLDGDAWRRHNSERDRSLTSDWVIENDEAWPFPSLHEKVSDMMVKLYG